MDIHTLLPAALIILSGGFLQGTMGFGLGVLCIPLLLTIGLPMPVVLVVASVCTAVQSTNGVHHLRRSVPWKDVRVAFLIRLVTMILGIWVLRWLVNHPAAQIRFWVGLVMLAVIILQVSWQPKPRARLHFGWNLAAFSASGFTGGLCGMGGPPLVQWVMAHDWDQERTRAFLFANFMLLVPVQLGVLYGTFGSPVLHGMVLGAVLSPFVLLGSLLGLRLGTRFSKKILRQVAFLLLVVIALNAMTTQIGLWLKWHTLS